MLVEVFGIEEATLGGTTVCSDGSGPASFAIPDLRLLVRSNSDHFDVDDRSVPAELTVPGGPGIQLHTSSRYLIVSHH
jgi:hypothetical protein